MLQIAIDRAEAIVYVLIDSKVVWSGSISEWSKAIVNPINNPYIPEVENTCGN